MSLCPKKTLKYFIKNFNGDLIERLRNLIIMNKKIHIFSELITYNCQKGITVEINSNLYETNYIRSFFYFVFFSLELFNEIKFDDMRKIHFFST